MITLLILTGGLGCATSAPKGTPTPSESAEAAKENAPETPTAVIEEEIQVTNEEMDRSTDETLSEEDQQQLGEQLGKAAASKNAAKIPVEVNEAVRKWITYFTSVDRERFYRFLQRGSVYRDVVQEILDETGVPRDLYYLAMIESGYVTHARSHAKAVGVWQFIGSTGRMYGLKQDRYVDERKDPIRATEAAAKYLRDLHKNFKSWYLAMAAYNAGDRRILRAIRKGGSRDFWTLVRRRVLPRETMDYVPKFLAAVIIGRHPEKYGFNLESDFKFPNVESVEVPPGVRLADISRHTSIPVATLRLVNPHLKQDYTPLNEKSYEVWVPEESVGQVKAAHVLLAKGRITQVPREEIRTVASASDRHYYQVRYGDNLSTIARRHKVPISYLKRVNGLASNDIMPGQKIRISAKSYRRPDFVQYRVRKGDSLVGIARKFRISVASIKEHNRIESNRIFAGQFLRIQGGRI